MNTIDARPSTGMRRPRLDRDAAMRLAETEYGRFLDLMRDLEPEDWGRPTDCPGWDVRAMAGHTVGMAQMASGVRETTRQMTKALRRGGVPLDALTGLQVEEHASLSAEEVVARLAAAAPKAARARARTPGFIRRRAMPDEQPVDAGSQLESWTLGYLLDVILTRDPWMHRVDICRAVEQEPQLTADHDGVLVADVAAEWAERHGQPCTLTLTGPAGGTWSWGEGGPALELDAVEFCRILAGRAEGHGLLATRVAF